MMNKQTLIIYLLVINILLIENAPQVDCTKNDDSLMYQADLATYFNATRAYNLIKEQVDFGPRIPGSEASEGVRNLVVSTLNNGKWQVEFQNFTEMWGGDINVSLVNIICSPKSIKQNQSYFLLLAHYDSRIVADNDPDPNLRLQPVLGANDGASGVAVALELGMVLLDYHNISNFQIILFDAEDQGGTGMDWIIGSSYFVSSEISNLSNISFTILFDMVGGANAKFKREGYSIQHAEPLVNEIWNTADRLGYDEFFINEPLGAIIDDHLPFVKQGIPSVDIIDDFLHNYDFWHTGHDTLDKISINTVEAVGRTVETVLSNFALSGTFSITLTHFTYISSINLIFTILPMLPLIIFRFRRSKR